MTCISKPVIIDFEHNFNFVTYLVIMKDIHLPIIINVTFITKMSSFNL